MKTVPGNLLRSLCYRSFAGACWYEARFGGRISDDRIPVLVYQMAKVGSSSVYRSLERYPHLNPFHVHHLSPGQLRLLRTRFRRTFAARREFRPNVRSSLFLRRQLDRLGGDGRWKVITLVRDPLARAVSGFFSSLGPNCPGLDLDRLTAVPSRDVASAVAPFFQKWLDRSDECGTWIYPPQAWLDQELREVFGVDVMAQPFARAKGYQVYTSGTAPVLLLKLERLNACAAEAFKEFLGLEQFTLVTSNQTENKPHAEVYQAFRESYEMSEAELDRFYDTPFARHFYAEEEIAAFRRRWVRRL